MGWNRINDNFGCAYWKAVENGYDVAFLLFMPEPENADRWMVCVGSGGTVEDAYDCPMLQYLTNAMPRQDAEAYLQAYIREN